MTANSSSRLYAHPFCREYWRDAASEFRNTRTLIFAALMIALRVVFKQIRIPVGPYLDINTAFLVNALGAMSFGPVVSIAAAAITDTLGALLFPTGPYFFPFILTEIAGSLLFALFFYRARITVTRVVLARFSVVFLVNLVLQTPIMALYYQMMLGKSYAWIDAPRIIKNLALFPFESLALVLFFRAAMPPLEREHVIRSKSEDLNLTRKGIISLVCLSLAGAAVFAAGSIYLHNQVSLSASYTAEERTEANLNCQEIVKAQDPELKDREIAAVVESAYSPFLSGQITWNVAVYEVKAEELAQKGEDFEGFAGYSKSKAAKDPALERLYTAEIVTDGAGNTLSFKKQ